MIIITDHAIYTTKKISKQRDTNRISYDMLCSYVAYSEDSQLSCALLNENEKIPVLERTLGDIFANRSYGEEITEFIQLLQLQLIAENKELGKQRKKTVEWAVEEANNAVVRGDLLNEKLYMIKELQKDPLYYKQMSMILGENYIRDCNISDFLDYVSLIRKKKTQMK